MAGHAIAILELSLALTKNVFDDEFTGAMDRVLTDDLDLACSSQ